MEHLCFDPLSNYVTIVSLCEDKIEQYGDCICYYMIYLCALSPLEEDSALHLESKIQRVIMRGLKLARNGCDGMLTRFLEHSFLVASHRLSIQTFGGKLLCYYLSTLEPLISDLGISDSSG